MNQCKFVLETIPGRTGGGVNTQQKSPSSRGTVSVQSSGEMRTHPDIFQFTITIRNSKESLEEAQTSIKRRTDYISQVIRKNGVKSSSIVVSTDMTRAGCSHPTAGIGGRNDSGACSDGMPQAGLATVHTEVVVSCNSMEKCETIRNILIEKLDISVEISPVTFWHTAEAKEKGRQEAFKRAVTSAKAKAECITQTVGVHLGPAIEVKEVQQDCIHGSAAVVREEGMDLESFQSTGLHQRHVNASILFTSQVVICFETQPARLCNHKKCRKH